MKWLTTRLLRLSFASLVAILGWPVAYAVAQPLPVCGWPFESNGRGITNVATPDTNATYWVMPFDTGSWAAMVIQGRYPKARFFNFDTYTSNGAAIDTIIDSNITPDPGSTNPFAAPSASQPQNYSVVISHGPTGSANSLRVGGSRLAFVVFRVYLPDMGIDKTGGFGLPLVSLIAPNGSVRRLQPCPFADAQTSATSLIAQLAQNGFIEAANFLAQILLATNQTSSVTCNPTQPGPASVSFAPATLGTNFFTNPQTTYLETPGFCFHQNKVLVVRGKALVFPKTYLHGPVSQPTFDTESQTRYWSMCNNDRVIPYPVIGCQADFATHLDQNQFYTYVISNDPAPPSWLPADATWLPWGITSVPKNLILRIILPANPGLAGGDYTPRGAFCDPAVLVQNGWQGCFAEAGTM